MPIRRISRQRDRDPITGLEQREKRENEPADDPVVTTTRAGSIATP